jgi:hypothetical protein
MRKTFTSAVLLVALSIGAAVDADVTIGAFTFDDTAFVDAVGVIEGTWTLDDGAESVPDAIVGPETDRRTWSTVGATFVEVLFEDNVVYNGDGADLAVFETGVLDIIAVRINGVIRASDTVFTGDVTPTRGYDVNVATFDLTDFGVPPGDSITSLEILGGFERAGTVAAYTVVGAIHASAPCPADLDGSGAVDAADLVALLAAWGDKGGPADLDGSGTVDAADLVLLLAAWGACA